MFSKSKLLATLAGFLVLYLLGWAFYGGLAENFFLEHSVSGAHKGDSVDGIWQIAIGSSIVSFMMTTIYQKWAKDTYSAKSGFQFGAYIGILLGLGLGIIIYATTNFMDFTGQLVDGLWNVVYYGIAGAAIGSVFKKLQK